MEPGPDVIEKHEFKFDYFLLEGFPLLSTGRNYYICCHNATHREVEEQ